MEQKDHHLEQQNSVVPSCVALGCCFLVDPLVPVERIAKLPTQALSDERSAEIKMERSLNSHHHGQNVVSSEKINRVYHSLRTAQ